KNRFASLTSGSDSGNGGDSDVKIFVQQKIPVPDHFQRGLDVLFLAVGEEQGEKDVEDIVAGGEGGDDVQAEDRVPVGDFHHLVAPGTGHLIVGAQDAHHMVVGGGAQVFGHGFHRAVGPREADDKGDGLFVFACGQIVA